MGISITQAYTKRLTTRTLKRRWSHQSFKIDGINEGWAWAERQWTKVTKDTGIGDPKEAAKEKGELYLKAVVGQIAQLLIQLSKADINDL